MLLAGGSCIPLGLPSRTAEGSVHGGARQRSDQWRSSPVGSGTGAVPDSGRWQAATCSISKPSGPGQEAFATLEVKGVAVQRAGAALRLSGAMRTFSDPEGGAGGVDYLHQPPRGRWAAPAGLVLARRERPRRSPPGRIRSLWRSSRFPQRASWRGAPASPGQAQAALRAGGLVAAECQRNCGTSMMRRSDQAGQVGCTSARRGVLCVARRPIRRTAASGRSDRRWRNRPARREDGVEHVPAAPAGTRAGEAGQHLDCVELLPCPSSGAHRLLWPPHG